MPLKIATGKQGVMWEGAFFACHSLALVNRELVLALLETNQFDIGIREPDAPAKCAGGWCALSAFSPDSMPRFAPLAVRLRAHPERPTVTVRHRWPPDFRRPDTPHFVLTQPWEFGSVPRVWVEGIAKSVDEVWVPSTFVQEEYVGSGVPEEKVFVVPNGVNIAQFHPNVAPLPLPTKKRFKFLFVGGSISRKGIDVLLDAYDRAFSAKDDVTLIVKDFGVHSFYAGQTAGALIAALQARPGAAEILYLTEDLAEEQMASLYAACDCLVHPYRGEGYGLPIAEAMACGKPAILTRFGAALDFANERNAYLIPATLVRFPEKRIGDLETVDYPFWAEPNREALIETMRRVVERPSEAQSRGLQAAQDIQARHTWAHAARIAAQRLQALHHGEAADRNTAHTTIPAAVRLEQRKQEALARTRAGEWENAIRQIEACLADAPDDRDLVNALAVALFRTGERARARALLEEGIARAPDSRDFHHNLAFLLLEEGEALEAIHHAMRAFLLTPDAPEIRRTLERARELARRQIRTYRQKTTPSPNAQRPTPNRDRYRALMEAVKRADGLLAGALPVSRKTDAAPSRPRLSLVMIAKNEERFLPGCLESVRDVVDEIVLVDTGSTDRTVEIAESFGAKVIHHPWSEDFSEARNVSLDHATGDWALWLDADERLAEGEGEALRALIENADPGVGGYMINIRNYMHLEKEADVCWHRACRLFRLLPQVRFTGRIHEQNVRQLQQAGYTLALCKITIDHYGYAASVMDERNKHERFIRMLTREVEENPDDTYRTFHLFNLANAYYTYGDMHNACKWFEKAAENPDPTEEYTALLFTEWATALYLTGRPQETLQVCDRAEAINIFHPALDFARGHAALRLQDYSAAERHFRRAIERGKSTFFVHIGDPGAHSYKAHYGLALAALGREDFEGAIQHSRNALQEKADFHDARYVLASALNRVGKKEEARAEYEALLAGAPDYGQGHVDLGALLHEGGDYPAALTHLRRASEFAPQSLENWLRLAACCERLALYDEARDAYREALRLSPRMPEVWVNLGRIYMAQGEDAKAIDAFAEAIQADPRYANAYFNAADVLYRLGYHSKAIEALYAGLERDPTNAAGFFVLGNCYFQIREYAAARRAYQEALALRHDYSEARHNLALAEERLAEPNRAA